MTSVTVINPNILTERDDAKHRAQRRQVVQAAAVARATNQRRHDNTQSAINGFPFPETIVAPKWRRHQEDYINPHLLPHERDPIAPRYGPDSVCQRLRARDDLKKCSCSYCVPALHKRAEVKREAEIALKKVVAGPGGGQALPPRFKKGPWADWDWNGQNDPYAYDGDQDWMLDYQLDKSAPHATLDLLSMAKPAKGRKKPAQNASLNARRANSLALARAFLEPVASGSGPLPDIDEISILDFEETWEHLDLERLNPGNEDDRGTEWQWERFSEF